MDMVTKPRPAKPHYIREWRKLRKKTQEELAGDVGVSTASISQLETGKQGFSDSTLYAIAEALDAPVGDLFHEPPGEEFEVPLVGYVGAGAAAHFYGDSQGELDRVPAPKNATKDTVAVEIHGESLGPLFDRWIVYYDDRRSPVTPDMIGLLCVVGLNDDRVLVKRIRRSRTPGLFHLESNTEPTILDVEIAWAAKVRSIEPR
jgi:transcriptional regulator with XRE-family HTH domain